jgi:hypothetical protein
LFSERFVLLKYSLALTNYVGEANELAPGIEFASHHWTLLLSFYSVSDEKFAHE